MEEESDEEEIPINIEVMKHFGVKSKVRASRFLEETEGDEEDADITVEGSDDGKRSHLFQPTVEVSLLGHGKNLALATWHEDAPRLVYVEYPGKVVNNDNALISLGGTGKISNTFASRNPKLEVKFRPDDPYCNPIYAETTGHGGWLFRIRRKKGKSNSTTSQTSVKCTINLDKIGVVRISPIGAETPYKIKGLCEPVSAKEDSNTRNNSHSEVRKVFAEQDRIMAAEIQSQSATPMKHHSTKKFLKSAEGSRTIRKMQEQELSKASDFQVECLGRVDIAYTFRRGQLCDYQYLPTRLVKGKQVSMLNKVLPIFNEPEKTVQFISESIDSETNTKTPLFLVPSFFSRIDKPVARTTALTEEGQRLLTMSCSTEEEFNLDELIDAERFLESPQASTSKLPSDFIVVPVRSKRIIYSHFANFRGTDAEWYANPLGNHVPADVMPGALQDIEKKGLNTGGLLELLRALFEQRPVWSKQALEFETKRTHDVLRYLLPAVSYFAVNGPWRSLWIKLGYDPRNFKESFEYQLLDYRIPYIYRNYAPPCSRIDERNCRYKPNMIPPKLQMYYQLCDVHIPEVEEIKAVTRARLREQQIIPTEATYSPKFGFVDEETLEYCRYCISRCIEEVLKQEGKITSLTLPPIALLPGGLVPKDVIRQNITNRKAMLPQRRHRKAGGSKGRIESFLPRGRARRNSGSSSVNDLEIDRDEFGKSESGESEEEIEFDDDDDSEGDITVTEWGMMDAVEGDGDMDADED